MLLYFKLIILIICILISFSFLTLFERKIIALAQIRLAPQINLFSGVIQPFIDALKLISKGFLMNEEKFNFNKFLLFFSSLMLIMYFNMWMIIPSQSGSIFSSSSSFLCFLALLSISLYPLIFISFFSFSKYPFMSLLRTVSQSISYEINFSLMILLILFSTQIFNLSKFYFFEFFFFINFIFIWILLFISIIESFRSPFDFSESESELVSGFSSEIGSLKFIYIFMAEYSIMFFYIMMISYLMNYFFLAIVLISFLFMFGRAIFPRIRYDFLMNLCWMSLFPSVSLLTLIFLCS